METIKEIFYSIRDNKMRTFMSGFGIAWGLMILVTLLGVGGGLEKGVQDILGSFTQKSIFVMAGKTSMPYKNFSEGRKIEYDKYLLRSIENRFPDVQGAYPQISISGLAVYGKYDIGAGVYGGEQVFMKAMGVKIEKGRHFLPREEKAGRNVAIIGGKVAQDLFVGQDPIGEKILIEGYLYTVVGTIKSDDQVGSTNKTKIFIPLNTFTKNITDAQNIYSFVVFLKDNSKMKTNEFIDELKRFLAHRLDYSPKDERALYVQSLESSIESINSVFKGISVFIWVTGLCFLITGMVGIGNIMFVVVKERTNEIGIRMAIGATPKNIIAQFIMEAIIITFISGIVGVALGGLILVMLNYMFSNMDMGGFPLRETVFDFSVGFGAMALMCVSGVIAGLFPALKAANIEPVNAIRQENRG